VIRLRDGSWGEYTRAARLQHGCVVPGATEEGVLRDEVWKQTGAQERKKTRRWTECGNGRRREWPVFKPAPVV
jgi:hypothetical protein